MMPRQLLRVRAKMQEAAAGHESRSIPAHGLTQLPPHRVRGRLSG